MPRDAPVGLQWSREAGWSPGFTHSPSPFPMLIHKPAGATGAFSLLALHKSSHSSQCRVPPGCCWTSFTQALGRGIALQSSQRCSKLDTRNANSCLKGPGFHTKIPGCLVWTVLAQELSLPPHPHLQNDSKASQKYCMGE